jgi:hypothetical protein
MGLVVIRNPALGIALVLILHIPSLPEEYQASTNILFGLAL